MIKFSYIAKSPEEHNLFGSVLSFANLDLLLQGKPIYFDLREFGIPSIGGGCLICVANEEFNRVKAKIMDSGQVRWCFAFSPEMIEELREGKEIACFKEDENVIILFKSGKDEQTVYQEMLPKIGPQTAVTMKGFSPSEFVSLN